LSDVPRRGWYLLFEALNLVDIAIAQQVLLSGDVLPTFMYDVTQRQIPSSPSVAGRTLFQAIQQAISVNAVLARNYVLYSLRREITSTANILAYAVALKYTTPDLLKRITRYSWDFHWNSQEMIAEGVTQQPKGWSVVINNKYYTLPNAEELSDGKLTYEPDLNA